MKKKKMALKICPKDPTFKTFFSKAQTQQILIPIRKKKKTLLPSKLDITEKGFSSELQLVTTLNYPESKKERKVL